MYRVLFVAYLQTMKFFRMCKCERYVAIKWDENVPHGFFLNFQHPYTQQFHSEWYEQ